MKLDINKIRQDFPIISETIYNKQLIYFDNAATSQKPTVVIEKIAELYKKYNSNIHRGVHFLSNYMTEATENSRKTVQEFLNARTYKEIIFTSGTTDSINLVAYSFGEAYIKEGDEIIVSEMEHHSNIVPWQLLCDRKRAKIKVLPFNDDGELEISKLENLINQNTKLICVTHVSNSLGTVNDIEKIINIAHDKGVRVLIDGAQAVHHIKVDVQELDCDFYVFSGHKAYGPTGTGVLYGKEELLEKMPPFKGGGEMIAKVSFEKTSFNELPFKFEAGTPNYIDLIGMAEALKYIQNIGFENIREHEETLLEYATSELKKISEINIIGNAAKKSGVISFLINNIHPFDAGTILDQLGIAVRTGTHCAETVMQHYNIEGTLRVSFAIYNTKQEIDALIHGIKRIISMF